MKECGSFGVVLAIVISRSIWWAILHGLFSWLYVLYYGLGYGQ